MTAPVRADVAGFRVRRTQRPPATLRVAPVV
jgi:hypothetical protein